MLWSSKTQKDWAEFVRKISDEICPQVKKIIHVIDNLKTHNPSSLYETFAPEEIKNAFGIDLSLFPPQTWTLVEHGRNRISCIKLTMLEPAYCKHERSKKGD